MRTIKENHQGISTILSFALIPISGFATDIYIPSLPAMADELHVSNTAVQLSLVIFMVSSGISQLFVGSLLDSFGRFRLNIAALITFALACFVIAGTSNIYVIYLMRVVHGVSVAMITVGKRAYFVDVFSGEKLKHYISMFSIIWATAPIIAPFLGGYLQDTFGWESNFYFLGGFTLVIMVLELIYGGESLRHFQKFELRSIIRIYADTVRTTDYTLGLMVIGLCYSMLMVYGMASPFIIEHVFNLSPVITGYCSLLSGVALMMGGMISKALINRSFQKKINFAIALQVVVALTMLMVSGYIANLYVMMIFVLLIHLVSGFVFNNFFSYCLGRFSKNAGIASGITGGSLYIITSLFSSGIINVLHITSQLYLGFAYIVLIILLVFTIYLFTKARAAAAKNLAVVTSLSEAG